MPSKYDVFISYSKKDQEFVQILVQRLVEAGVSVFFDEADIAIGQSLAKSLHQAVQDAQYMLVVMSPDYFASHWAQEELNLALQQEFEGDRTKVIPLLIRDCKIPMLLSTKLYADFREADTFDQTFSKLLAAIKGVPASAISITEESKDSAQALGSITPATAESAELRAMVADLQNKVEAFMV